MIHFPTIPPSLIPSLSNSSHHSFDDPLSPVKRSLSPVGLSEDLSFDMTMVEDITDQTTLEKVSAIKTTVLESSAFPQAKDLNVLFLERQVSNGAEILSTPKVDSFSQSAFDFNETAAEMGETIPTSSVPQLDSPFEPSTPCVVETTKSKKRKKKSEDEVDPDKTFSEKKRERMESSAFFQAKDLNVLFLERQVSNGAELLSIPKVDSFSQSAFDSNETAVEMEETIPTSSAPQLDSSSASDKSRNENKVDPDFSPSKSSKKRQGKRKNGRDELFREKINELISFKHLPNPFTKVANSISSKAKNTDREHFRRFYRTIVDCLDWEIENNTIANLDKIKEISQGRAPAKRVEEALINARIPENRVAFQPTKKRVETTRKKSDATEKTDTFLDKKIDKLISLKSHSNPFEKVARGISRAPWDARRRQFRVLHKVVVDCLAWETKNNTVANTNKIKEISQGRASVDRVEKALIKARIPENRVAFKMDENQKKEKNNE